MREIKEMTLEHLDEYVELAYHTYPSFKDNSKEGIAEFKKLITMRMTDPNSCYYGMFDDGKLISAVRFIDFKMNFFGEMITASGLASLAVHLMHKKERVAKTMMDYYEDLNRERGIPIATLLPFVPDFYKKMGYGLGTKMNQFRIPTERFPVCYLKSDLRILKSEEEKQSILAFYSSILKTTHGLFDKIPEEIADLFQNADNKVIASYDDSGEMDGCVIFEFKNGKADNYTINNMVIKELHYANADALDKILGFIKKQADQVNLVIYNTQDEYFAHKIDNPLNDSLNYTDYGYMETNTQSVGIMYKILDIKDAFKKYDYRNYNQATLKVKFYITDEAENTEEIIVHFDQGKAAVADDDFDVEVDLSIVDFSSLFVGCISIMGLYRLGLLRISEVRYLEALDLAFYCPQKPISNTDF